MKFAKNILSVLLVLVFAIGLLTGCGDKKDEFALEDSDIHKPEEIVIDKKEVVEEEKEESPAREGMAISKLTGLYIDEDLVNNRPVAVMIGNTVDALPQYGIYDADILYQVPVEGGLTRLMAIFDDYSKVPKIGSVRSCRLYFAHFACEYDAIYCHFGQASYAESFLNSSAIDNLSGLDGSISSTYYRDNNRKAPHNAFTSPEGINSGIEKKGYRKTYKDGFNGHFKFANPDGDKVILSGTDAAVMKTGYSVDKTWFVYNKETGTYDRFMYKKEHTDADNRQLSFENVLFIDMDVKKLDQKGYLEINTAGSGKGMYFTGGKMEEITWKNDKATGVPQYTNSKGEELVLNPGKTCVCVIDNSSTKNVSVFATYEEYEASLS